MKFECISHLWLWGKKKRITPAFYFCQKCQDKILKDYGIDIINLSAKSKQSHLIQDAELGWLVYLLRKTQKERRHFIKQTGAYKEMPPGEEPENLSIMMENMDPSLPNMGWMSEFYRRTNKTPGQRLLEMEQLFWRSD